MKPKTKFLLEEAQAYCDQEDKSTEFMIQYMQDFAEVDFDCVMSFLEKQSVDAEVDKTNTNLCDDCKYHIATCEGNPKFGNGIGNDNVYSCDKYNKS